MPTMTKYDNGVPNWVDVAVPDLAVATAFYCDLFGWTADDQGEEAGGCHMFLLDGAPVAGTGPQLDAPALPLWSTYLSVDDLDATLALVEPAGGTIVMPRTDVLKTGSMAVVKDPSGAAVSFWQAGEHIGAQVVNEPNTLTWNELTTRDATGAMAFYESVVGAEFGPLDDGAPDGYQRMMVEGRVVAGVLPMEGEDWGDLPSHWMTYFGSVDTDATAERAAELGGVVSVPPFDLPVGRVAVLNDPSGTAFSVVQFAAESD